MYEHGKPVFFSPLRAPWRNWSGAPGRTVLVSLAVVACLLGLSGCSRSAASRGCDLVDQFKALWEGQNKLNSPEELKAWQKDASQKVDDFRRQADAAHQAGEVSEEFHRRFLALMKVARLLVSDQPAFSEDEKATLQGFIATVTGKEAPPFGERTVAALADAMAAECVNLRTRCTGK